MKHLKRIVGTITLIFFVLSPLVGLAAEKQWCVVKDKKEKCRVIQCEKKTPKTVAGPFKTKDEADKAKAKECP